MYHNAVRTAEVNLDKFKRFFYAQAQQVSDISVNLTSLQQRKTLKTTNQCKDMSWFMENIIPEMPVPPTDAVYYESLTNEKSGKCLEAGEEGLAVKDCFPLKHQQVFFLDTSAQLRTYSDKKCVMVEKEKLVLKGSCLGSKWKYKDKQLQQDALCMFVNDTGKLAVEKCYKLGRESYWNFKYHFDWSKPLSYAS